MKIPADWCNRRRSCTPSAAFQSALCHPFPPALKNAPACLKSVLSHPQRYYFQRGFRSGLPKSGFCPSYSAPARPAALPQGWSYGSYRQSAPHIEAAHWSASYSSLKWRRRSPYSSDPAASCGREVHSSACNSGSAASQVVRGLRSSLAVSSWQAALSCRSPAKTADRDSRPSRIALHFSYCSF